MKNREVAVSAEYKKQAALTLLALACFIVVYLALLVLTVLLTAVCIVGGVKLVLITLKIDAPFMFASLMFTGFIAIGLISFGLLVLLFVFKFMLAQYSVDRSSLKQLNERDEPKLFQFIYEIADELNVSRPKNIYLTSEVSAAVFYDSNFWSMFLPVRKNLRIGLGLVNSVSKSELKSIIAHELGHFSQGTMRIGTYAYYVNRIIYNMLNETDGYDRMVDRWNRIHLFITLFNLLAIKVVGGVKWLLLKLYDIVNIPFMGLSREMEFHADTIAASVTGYEPFKSVLLRSGLIEYAYDRVTLFYLNSMDGHLQSENLYSNQSLIVKHEAQENQIAFLYGLPQVSKDELNRYNKSKLNIKDQWSSHPSISERIQLIENMNPYVGQMQNEPANWLFQNVTETQKQMTEWIFESSNEDTIVLSDTEFLKEYKREVQKNTFPKLYNGYYDDKNPVLHDLDSKPNVLPKLTFEDFFSRKQIDKIYTSIALKNDIQVLEDINQKVVNLRTFDYDGKKYTQKQSADLIVSLSEELDAINLEISSNDHEVFYYFLQKEMELCKEPRLLDLYVTFSKLDIDCTRQLDIYRRLSDAVSFMNGRERIDKIQDNLVKVGLIEKEMKAEIEVLLTDIRHKSSISEDAGKHFKIYISQSWQYFGGDMYFEDAVEILIQALNSFGDVISSKYFEAKKELLEYQADVLMS